MSLFLKAAVVWFAMALFAILNGILRENLLMPSLGETISQPLSGILLSILIFVLTYLFFPFYAKQKSLTYLLIGVQWISMTLAFEFLFGHYVLGKSWLQILEVFNIFTGNLFTLALLVTLFAPLLVSQQRKKK